MNLNFINFRVEKRIFVLLPLIFLLLVVFRASAIRNNELKSPTTPLDRQELMLKALVKIKGEASWKPNGFGTGEFLTDLPVIAAGAIINLDSGDVIWSMNLRKRIAPASLGKIATVMTALDISDEGHTLLVDKAASNQIPTKLGLSEGEKLTLSEAAAAAVLTSANDATEAISGSLGKEIGNGTPDFLRLVNEKLKKIGAIDSHFETSTGLDSANHFSTVYDLAIIGHEAKTNYPLISSLAATKYQQLALNENHKVFDLPNWNALLGTYPGVNGLKIGYTEDAGHATMVTAERNSKKLIAIVIGANSLEEREKAAAVLLNYGFMKNGIEPFPVDELNLVGRFEDWRRQLSYKR